MKNGVFYGSSSVSKAEQTEARFALRVTALLDESAQNLPQDVTERLRVARQNALQQAASSRVLAKPAASKAGFSLVWNKVFSFAGGPSDSDSPAWWNKLASALPLAVLVLGLLAIQELHSSLLISAAADIDAALLADDLPPDAYQDAGFLEFLKRPVIQE
ncbi:MAG: DUF3619 family protein [Burkholderiales bacterium]